MADPGPLDFALQQIALLKEHHPVFFVLILVPLVTVVLNAGIYFLTSPGWPTLLKNHPRVAASFKMLEAFGINPITLAKWAYVLFTGKAWTPPPGDDGSKPKKTDIAQPPTPPASNESQRTRLKLCVLFAAIAVLLLGCPPKGASSPATVEKMTAEVARGGIVLAAKATYAANEACNGQVKELEKSALAQPSGTSARKEGLAAALKLGEDCSNESHAIAELLSTAEKELDAADAVVGGKVACAALAGIEGLRHLADFLARAGAQRLPIIEQAIKLNMPIAALAGGSCPVPAKGGS